VGAASPLCFWIAANPRGFTQRGAKGTLLHRPGLARPMSAEEKGAKDIPARRHGQHKPAATFFNRRGGRCFSGCDWSLCISLRTYQGFKPIAVVPSQPRPAHGVGPWHSSRKYTAVSPGSAVGDLCHSAPMPVLARTYSSGHFCSDSGSLLSRVPRQAPKNPMGTERMAGLFKGKRALSPMKLGLISTRMTELISPDRIPHTAPEVLNRLQNRVNRITGRLALEATAKARATRKATFMSFAIRARMIEATPTPTEASLATRICSSSVALPPRRTLE